LNSGGGLAFSHREDVVTRRTAASLIAVLMLAACAHEGGGAAEPGMAWSLTSNKEEGSKLGYGAPDTDNLVLMLVCQPKSGQVQVWLMGPAGEKATRLVLSSGGRTARVPRRSDGDGYEALHATVPANDAVFTGFASTGTLGFSVEGRHGSLPGAGANATKFVESCRS
jgi:hypothetical protein